MSDLLPYTRVDGKLLLTNQEFTNTAEPLGDRGSQLLLTILAGLSIQPCLLISICNSLWVINHCVGSPTVLNDTILINRSQHLSTILINHHQSNR